MVKSEPGCEDLSDQPEPLASFFSLFLTSDPSQPGLTFDPQGQGEGQGQGHTVMGTSSEQWREMVESCDLLEAVFFHMKDRKILVSGGCHYSFSIAFLSLSLSVPL